MELEAVQVFESGAQTVQVRSVSGGWGRTVYQLKTSEGRLALLGWARMPES